MCLSHGLWRARTLQSSWLQPLTLIEHSKWWYGMTDTQGLQIIINTLFSPLGAAGTLRLSHSLPPRRNHLLRSLWHMDHLWCMYGHVACIMINQSSILTLFLFSSNSFSCWLGMRRSMPSCSVTTSSTVVGRHGSYSDMQYLKVSQGKGSLHNIIVYSRPLFDSFCVYLYTLYRSDCLCADRISHWSGLLALEPSLWKALLSAWALHSSHFSWLCYKWRKCEIEENDIMALRFI